MQTVAQAAKRSAKTAPKPSRQDLRFWIDALRAAGLAREPWLCGHRYQGRRCRG